MRWKTRHLCSKTRPGGLCEGDEGGGEAKERGAGADDNALAGGGEG